jgi:hypothetical protein
MSGHVRRVNAGAGLPAKQRPIRSRFAGKPALTVADLKPTFDQTTPWASIASATFTKPATLAPSE